MYTLYENANAPHLKTTPPHMVAPQPIRPQFSYSFASNSNIHSTAHHQNQLTNNNGHLAMNSYSKNHEIPASSHQNLPAYSNSYQQATFSFSQRPPSVQQSQISQIAESVVTTTTVNGKKETTIGGCMLESSELENDLNHEFDMYRVGSKIAPRSYPRSAPTIRTHDQIMKIMVQLT